MLSHPRQRRVLVTGGAGFIGSELVTQLVHDGHEVTVVDNLVNGKRENLAHLPPGILQEVDIRDVAEVNRLLEGQDIVFHLACLGVRHSIHAPRENHDVNATATLDLLALSQANRVKKFIYVSSSEVYGTALWAPMTEEHPTIPMTVYGASKLAGECYARAFFRTYGYPTVVVRPFNSFGPRSHHEGDSGEVIPKFILRALANQPMVIFGDGTQTRDFTFVRDTARGILLAGFSDAVIGETVNIGSSHELAINELANTIKTVLGKPGATVEHIEDRPGDVLRLFSNPTKAEELLNFRPTTSLFEGLSELVAWYEESGASPEELLKSEVTRNWATQKEPAHA